MTMNAMPQIVIRRLAVCVFALWLIVLPVLGQDGTTSPVIYVVQRGDTLYSIAQRYNTTVEALAQANGIRTPGSILVGQRLIIAGGLATETPSTHLVQPGETLASIAVLYGVPPEQLSAINGLTDPNTLYVGQALLLYTHPVLPPVTDAPGVPVDALPDVSAALIVPEAAEDNIPASAPVPVIPVVHTISGGETLMRIAAQYGAVVSEIIQANNIEDPSLIYAGQQIVIPGVTAPQLASDLPVPFAAAQITPLTFTAGQAGMVRVVTLVPADLTGTFLDQTLRFAAENDGTLHTAFIGIPMTTPGGTSPVTLIATERATGAASTVTANIQVTTGSYPVEQFTLLADRSNLLDPAIDEAELSILRSVTGQFNPARGFQGVFGLPAAATITSPFGATRSYDGGAITRTHIGTDFAGVPGTPILAAAAGTVVLADTLNVRGLAVVVDHGWGVFSGYYHQTERYVGIGESIREGQVIGTIGSSGRVSGPHLHWEVWINGVPVDPMQWVLMNFAGG